MSQNRAEQLAHAMLQIAKVNHYMVGLVDRVSADEVAAAQQILITGQNALRSVGALHRRYELALDLLEQVKCEESE